MSQTLDRTTRRTFDRQQDHGDAATYRGREDREELSIRRGYAARRRAEGPVDYDSGAGSADWGILNELSQLGRTARRRNIPRRPRTLAELRVLSKPPVSAGPFAPPPAPAGVEGSRELTAGAARRRDQRRQILRDRGVSLERVTFVDINA